MKALSVREVIETARKVTGHSIPALETARRAGDPAKLVASSEKAKKFSVGILFTIVRKKSLKVHGTGIKIIRTDMKYRKWST